MLKEHKKRYKPIQKIIRSAKEVSLFVKKNGLYDKNVLKILVTI